MIRVRSPMLDRTLYTMGAVGEWHIGLVLAFEGRLDADRLQQALRLSVSAVPHLGGRFVPGRWNAYWEWDENHPQDVVLAQAPADATDPAQHEFFLTPVDSFAGPQVQALLLRGENDTLCLKLSHYATDAGGLKAYAYLLGDIYRRLADDVAFRPSVDRSSRSLRRISNTWTFAHKWRAVKRAFAEVRNNPPRPLPLVPPGKAAAPDGRAYVVRHIGPDRFARLVGWTKPRGLTINDALIAGLLRALACYAPPNKERLLRIIATADLRRYLPPGEDAVANLSGWVYANFGRELGADFEQTALRVGAEMRRLKTDTLGWGIAPFLVPLDRCLPVFAERWLFSRLLASFGRQNSFAPSLTNMGPIDPARLDFGPPARRVYLVVPLIFPPVFGAGVSGFRDTLTLTAGYCASGVDGGMMNELFDRWLSELPS